MHPKDRNDPNFRPAPEDPTDDAVEKARPIVGFIALLIGCFATFFGIVTANAAAGAVGVMLIGAGFILKP